MKILLIEWNQSNLLLTLKYPFFTYDSVTYIAKKKKKVAHTIEVLFFSKFHSYFFKIPKIPFTFELAHIFHRVLPH